MWTCGTAAGDLATDAVEDDGRQDEHHAGDHDHVGDVVGAPVAGVMAAGSGQEQVLYRQHALVIQNRGAVVKSINHGRV